MEKIQMTEEQAVKMWTTCISPYEKTELAFFIKNMKDEGYIKQNPVEEGKEIFRKYRESEAGISSADVIAALYKAIEYLERKHENRI